MEGFPRDFGRLFYADADAAALSYESIPNPFLFSPPLFLYFCLSVALRLDSLADLSCLFRLREYPAKLICMSFSSFWGPLLEYSVERILTLTLTLVLLLFACIGGMEKRFTIPLCTQPRMCLSGLRRDVRLGTSFGRDSGERAGSPLLRLLPYSARPA